jgi:hypothetical protein
MATVYRIFWDEGRPGENGRSKSWPCGWCWSAIRREPEIREELIGSGTLGVSGKPFSKISRSFVSLVRELRKDVKGTRLAMPPTRGHWHDLSMTCLVEDKR